jgi:hypothetical protein
VSTRKHFENFLQLDHVVSNRRRDPIYKASSAQEVFAILKRTPGPITHTDAVAYTDEDALFMFRIVMKSSRIDAYSFQSVVAASDKTKYDVLCGYFSKSELERRSDVFDYSYIVDRKILTLYIPFARFQSVKTFNGYIMLLQFDKVYLADAKTCHKCGDYTPEPAFADETVNNVYRMYGLVEPFQNKNNDIHLRVDYPIDITIINTQYVIPKYQIKLETYPGDTLVLSKQEVPDHNGEYIIVNCTDPFCTIRRKTTERPKRLSVGTCLSDTRITIEYLCKTGDWDSPCVQNKDCPFYNEQTGQGGCNNGYCQMPIGVQRRGYTKYKGKPFCNACSDPLKPECCEDRDRYVF